MEPNHATLNQLQHILGQKVAEVMNLALAVEPPGGLSAAWQELLGHYQVIPVSQEQRFAEIQREKQTKGAPLSEVKACLLALVELLQTQFMHLAGPVDAEKQTLLKEGLSHLVEKGVAHYRAISCERPRGMFGHAMITAHQHKYANLRPGAYVLLCPTCGGPRLNPNVLICDYCGGTFTTIGT